MAISILKLTDGVNTIDFHSTEYRILTGGLDLSPPALKASFVQNPFIDGDRLSSASYSNRTISIRFLLSGTDYDNLQTNERAIQRLLNDARKRMILGYGAQVYLEYQWGLAAGESVYFDVDYGDLILPPNFSSPFLWRNNLITDAVVKLNCRPFGRYMDQDIAQDSLNNSQSPYIIKDSYLVDDDAQYAMNAANDWECMSFTTTSAFSAAGAAIMCFRGIGDVLGDIIFELYLADGAHFPTGAILASGTKSGNYISETVTYPSWLFCIFDNPVALANAVEYCLVVRGDALGAGDVLSWRADSTNGYAGGQRSWSITGVPNWNAAAGDDFLFAIFAAETKTNYQDITTTATYGDVPAKLYQKLSQTGATGTKKIWIAKRSGLRQKDDLWLEGEELSSSTDIVNDDFMRYADTILLSGVTGDMHAETLYYNDTAPLAADNEVARLNYTIHDIPRGQFRVLARCRAVTNPAVDYDHISWGFGWSYGDKTYTPTEVKGEYYQCAANNVWEILDFGVLNIPPIAESDIAINNNFELRIYQYATEQLGNGDVYQWQTDYIFLLPIDEGVVIIDDVVGGGTPDVIAIDGITDPPNVFILSAINVIENYPAKVGKPFSLGRESTRIYVLRDDVKGMTFSSDIKYQPQFLVV